MGFDRIDELYSMNVLVIAATERELSLIKEISFAHTTVKVHFAVTGVGLMPSTYAIMQLIASVEPGLVVDLAFETDRYHDIFELGLAEKNMPPFEQGAIVNHHDHLILAAGLHAVAAVSVNEISSNPLKIALFAEKYKGDIESMEGAALHYVCTLQQIPFIQIRGISNLVGERDKAKWKIPESLLAATNACINLINKIQLS